MPDPLAIWLALTATMFFFQFYVFWLNHMLIEMICNLHLWFLRFWVLCTECTAPHAVFTLVPHHSTYALTFTCQSIFFCLVCPLVGSSGFPWVRFDDGILAEVHQPILWATTVIAISYKIALRNLAKFSLRYQMELANHPKEWTKWTIIPFVFPTHLVLFHLFKCIIMYFSFCLNSV